MPEPGESSSGCRFTNRGISEAGGTPLELWEPQGNSRSHSGSFFSLTRCFMHDVSFMMFHARFTGMNK